MVHTVLDNTSPQVLWTQCCHTLPSQNIETKEINLISTVCSGFHLPLKQTCTWDSWLPWTSCSFEWWTWWWWEEELWKTAKKWCHWSLVSFPSNDKWLGFVKILSIHNFFSTCHSLVNILAKLTPRLRKEEVMLRAKKILDNVFLVNNMLEISKG